MVCGFFECGIGFGNRRGDVRSAALDYVCVEGFEGEPERVVVERERALQERLSAERDYSDSVAVERVEEVEHREFCAFEAARFYVFCEHAFGRVYCENYVDSARFAFRPMVSPLRAGEGDEDRENSQRKERLFDEFFCGAYRARKFGQKFCRREFREQAFAAAFAPRE